VIFDHIYDGAGGTRGRQTIFAALGTGGTNTVLTVTSSADVIGAEAIALECAGSITTGANGANAIRNINNNSGAADNVATATLSETPWTLDGTVLFTTSNSQNVAVTAGGAETLLQSLNHSGPSSNAAALWVAPDGDDTMSATWTGNADWGAVIIELKEASAVAPGGGSPTGVNVAGELSDNVDRSTYTVSVTTTVASPLLLMFVHTQQSNTVLNPLGNPSIPVATASNAVVLARETAAENLYDVDGGTTARLSFFRGIGPVSPGTFTIDVTLGGIVHLGCEVIVIEIEDDFDVSNANGASAIRQVAFDANGTLLSINASVDAGEACWDLDRAFVALARNTGNDVPTADTSAWVDLATESHSGPISGLDVFFAAATAPSSVGAGWGTPAYWGAIFVEIKDPAAVAPTDPGGDGIPDPELVGFVYSNQDSTGGAASAYQTNSFTPEASALLVACVTNEQSSAVGAAATPSSLTGHGTWTLVEDNNYDQDGGTRGRQTVWRCKVGGSPSSAGVYPTFGVAQLGCSVQVVQFSDSGDLDTGGTNGANAIRNSAQAEAIGVHTIAASLDETVWSLDTTLAFVQHQAVEDVTPGSGFTILGQGSHPGPVSALASMYAPSGPQAALATWVSNVPVGVIVLEMKDTNSVPPTTTPTTGHPWIDLIGYSTSRRLRPTSPYDPQFTGECQEHTESYVGATDVIEQIMGRPFNGQREYHDIGGRFPAPKDPPSGGDIGGRTPSGGWYDTMSDLDILCSTGPPAAGTGPHVLADPGNLFEAGHRAAYLSLHSHGGGSFSADMIVANDTGVTEHAPGGETAEAYFKWIGGLILAETTPRYRFWMSYTHEPENDFFHRDASNTYIKWQDINVRGGGTGRNSRVNFGPAFEQIIDWWAEIGLVPRRDDPDSPLLGYTVHLLQGTYKGGQHGPLEEWITPSLAAKIHSVGASGYSRWKSPTRAKALMDPVHNAGLAMTGAPWNLATPLKCSFGEFGIAEGFVGVTAIPDYPETWAEVALLTPTPFKATFWAELASTLKSAAYNNNVVSGEPDVEFISVTDHFARYPGDNAPMLYPVTSSTGSTSAFTTFMNDTTALDTTHTIFGKPLTTPEIDAWSGTTSPGVDPPVVTSFTPTSGPPGTSVTITGQFLSGATSVEFGGVATASFIAIDDSTITATVPAGAVDGVITVTSDGGSDDSSGSFDVTSTPPANPPTISSFSPSTGVVGVTVTITGQYFTGASFVRFNGVAATFVVNSDTSISATLPSGATDGVLSVQTSQGIGYSSASFDVTVPAGPPVGDVPSTFNPTDDLMTTVQGIWLIDADFAIPTDEITQVRLEDTQELPEQFGASVTTLYPIGSQRPVSIRENLRGYEGTISGLAVSRTDRRALERLATPLGRHLRLVVMDMNISIELINLSIGRLNPQLGMHPVSLEVVQVDDYTTARTRHGGSQ
jgi:hypothetical protein